MRDSNNGFVIAEKDLELRGPGEVLGTRQTGLLQLRIADLQRDAGLLPAIVEYGRQLYQQYPALVEPIIERWLPNRDQYARV